LIHPFAFIPVEKVAQRLGWLDGPALMAVLIVATVAMLAAGLGLHLLVERPMGRILQRRFLGR
jgi:peptidoglycan/LPS O-acetylase OafA/YrhL